MLLVANYIDKNKNKVGPGTLAAELMRDLASHGVPVVETSNNNLNITTPHVYITFVDDVNKLRGRKFDEIFGPVPVDILLGCLKRERGVRFKGTLLDYILLMEDV